MCSKLKDDLTITITTARKWSKEINKANGNIPIGELLEMNVVDLIMTCGRNNLDLVYKGSSKDDRIAKFQNPIEISHSVTEDKYYSDHGYTFIGVGNSKHDGEVHYFVKE
jgi:hypothetical protein